MQVIYESYESHTRVISKSFLFQQGIVWREGQELKIRLYDSFYEHVGKHVRLAQTIQVLVYLMGVKFNTATHVSGLHQQPLKQRASRNLCGIHVFARAWMIATDQVDDSYDYNHAVVDVIHDYVKVVVLSGDQRLCYPLTNVEKENNDFQVLEQEPVRDASAKPTDSPVTIM